MRPEIIEIRGELKRLHNGVQRLSSLIKIEEPHRELKEVTKKTKEEEEKEHGRGRRKKAGGRKPRRR
jgi:hypothetical protein